MVTAVDVSATKADFKYRAFIAYSHQDEHWAKWLHKVIETYRVPTRLVGTTTAAGVVPRRLTPLFRDRSELPSAADLEREVNEALDQSANLIVICSPRSAKSTYVNEEVSTFKRLGRTDRILCLIIDGEPNATDLPGRELDECFATALRHQFDGHGAPTRERAAPIAADVRPGKDGRTNAKLKLIAGMLGIGFDALKQREHQRHVRRLITIAAVSIVAMLITTGLAIDAAIARKTAERRQRQAEGLVEFMLGDLNDRLSQVQRLDILEATNKEAMKYFESLPTNDVTDQALLLRSKALEHIGDIRESQGKLPLALESYRAASALTRELAARAPADSARQIAYANSFNWIGQAYWFQGDLDRSLQNFQQAILLLDKQVAARPKDAPLAASLASARTNAGRVFEARGDYASAKELYRLVQQTYEALRTREPDNIKWQSELGFAYNNLGKVALEQGQLAQAIEAYRDDQRIKSALAAKDPKNYDLKEDLVIANAILGRTLALCGASDASLQYARDAVDLSKSMVAYDRTQASWREDLGTYSQLLGGILRQRGELGEAAQLDTDAVRILEELVATDNTNARWKRELASAQVEAARLELARRDYAAAQHGLDRALTTIQAERAKTPGDVAMALLAADAYIVGGRIVAKRADEAAARPYWIQARDTIVPITRIGDDPNVLSTWASALLLLSDVTAARPVVQRLGTMGYQTADFAALLAAKKLPYAVDPSFVRRITTSLILEEPRPSD